MGSSSERNCDARNNVPGRNMSVFRSSLKKFEGSQHTDRWLLSELDHLPQADSCRWETRVVLDGVHQALCLFPRHLG